VRNQVVNIVSAYAPQTGRTINEKETFWLELGKVMDKISVGEGLIVCDDMNSHVGASSDGFEGFMGDSGMVQEILKGRYSWSLQRLRSWLC